jgi:hypothetical protein
MKVNAKQKSAKAWNNSLNKLNEAQIGQIAITYKSDDGKKQLGYVALTDIELDLGKKKITLGALLATLIKNNNDLMKENKRLGGIVKANSEQIKSIEEILAKYLPNLTL